MNLIECKLPCPNCLKKELIEMQVFNSYQQLMCPKCFHKEPVCWFKNYNKEEEDISPPSLSVMEKTDNSNLSQIPN